MNQNASIPFYLNATLTTIACRLRFPERSGALPSPSVGFIAQVSRAEWGQIAFWRHINGLLPHNAFLITCRNASSKIKQFIPYLLSNLKFWGFFISRTKLFRMNFLSTV